MNRHSFLGFFGVMGLSSLAGCLDAIPLLGSKTKLARLSVRNWDKDEAHTIDVRVERDWTVVHESSSSRPTNASRLG
ncbi:hypothetical protein [Haladaptatus sp. NG-WS-4]